MKKKTSINILAIAILSFCLVHYINIEKTVPSGGELEFSTAKDISTGSSTKEETHSDVIKPDFSAFPIGEAKDVEFSLANEVKAELSKREQKNQARDWLIYSIVNNLGLPEDNINKILFDVPLIRYGYNHSVYDLEYGELRSILLPDNSIIALIPKGTPQKQQDDLAHIADKERKNLGSIPENFVVFEYEIHSGYQKASIHRKENVSGKDLFSEGYLYHETKVTNLKDLEGFMSEVQDLTFVRQEKGALLLGGRKLVSRSYKNIGVEDIAAIWQSEKKFPEKGTGFSLDPAYDFEGLKSLVREFPKLVVTALKKSGQISGGGNSYSYSSIDDSEQNEIINLVIKELGKKNPTPLFYVYDYVTNGGGITDITSFLSGQSSNSYAGYNFLVKFDDYQFQAARYDGYLKGTEVGMTLYYTDLLAKMWAMNFEWTTPLKEIPEFVNDPLLKLSKIYAEESDKYNSGRLWFGPNQNGFQLSDDRTLLFARNATRIFSASKDGLSADKEVPASALIGAPIYWWNDHYEEVAVYEQQYEALNEIMKWSVVIGWLNNKKEEDLDYLKKVEVFRGNWFPKWVKDHPELRFKNWDAVGFFPKGHKGTTTEALPTLYSPSYSQFGIDGQRMTGGVTLARRADIARIKPITELKLDKTFYRSNIEASLSKNTFRTIKGTEFKILNSKLVTRAGENARLRNLYTEFSRKPITKAVSNDFGNARFTTMFDDVLVGNLNVSPSKNGFQIGFQNRAVGQGNHLARQISDSRNIQSTLRRNAHVDEFLTLETNQSYLVKLKGNHKWMEIEIVNNPTAELGSSWHFRTAGFRANSKVVRQKWISSEKAGELAKSYGKEWKSSITNRPPPKVLEQYASQNYKSVTNEVLQADNPMKIKNSTKDFLKKELKDIDNMIQKVENLNLCEGKLNQLTQYFGNRPEISMRKALVELNQKLPGANQRAANQFNQVANKLAKDNARLLSEINNIIESSNLHLSNRNTAQNFMKFKAGKSNVLKIEGKALPDGKIVNHSDVATKLTKNEGILYIENHPGLNNLNWNSSANQTLAKVMDLHPEAVLKKIPKKSLANYQPELSVNFEFSPLTDVGVRPKFKVDLTKVRPGVNVHNNHCEDEEKDCKDIYVLSITEGI